MTGPIAKTSAEYKDYTLTWPAADLGTDTIASSAWSASPAGLTIDQESNTATAATAWIGGGSPGVGYQVSNTITTSGGRVLQQQFYCIVSG